MLNHPLPRFIERSQRAQQLLPSHRPLVEFLHECLSRFQRSNSKFQVVCSIPQRHDGGPVQRAPVPIKPRERLQSLIILDSSFNPPTIAHMRMAVAALRDIPGAREHSRLLLLLSINNADKAPKPAAFEQRLAMMTTFAHDILAHTDAGQERAGAEAGEEQTSQGSEEDQPIVDIGLTTLPYFHDKSAVIAASDFYTGTETGVETAQPGPEQVFLIGYDTLIRIFNPKYYTLPPGSSDAQAPQPTAMQQALSPFFSQARLRVTMRAEDEWGGKDDQTAYVDSLLRSDALDKVGGKREWAVRVELVEGRKAGEPIVSSTMAREAARGKNWERLGQLVSLEVGKWIESEGLYRERDA